MGDLADQAREFIAKGGIINLSFGGAIDQFDPTQDHVQRACTNTNQLADLIYSTLQKFGTHNVEFDIEGDYLMNDGAARKRLAQAVANVKQRIPDLHVTYTLATDTDGLPDTGLQQVEALRDAGVKLDVLSLMTMDMTENHVLDGSISAVKAGAKQLENVYGLPAGSGISHMGVIPMPGKDDQGALFSVSDASQLAEFARDTGIAYVSYWAFNRDLAGTDKDDTTALANVAKYQFFSTFRSTIKSVSIGGTAAVDTSSTARSSSITSSTSSSAHPDASATVTVTVTASAAPCSETDA
jgi:chitinase